MDPQEAVRRLREQAQSIPHPPAPHLKQRKPIPGTSTFSVTDTGTQTTFPSSLVDLRHDSTPNSSVLTSGIQFRPPITPASLPRSHLRRESAHSESFPLASSSHLPLDDDPFQPNDFHDPDPDYPEQDLNGLDQDSFVSRRHRTTDSYTKIHNLLAGLRRERISPVDILLQVLDPDDLAYDRYRGNLFRDDNTKLASLIETIMSDQKGKEKLSQCMEPHLLDFACDTVAEQMETRRKKSILPGIEAITPAFTESWNLDEQIDHSPFLSQILETAAQTERAKLYNKKKKPDKVLTSYSDYFHWLLTALVSCARP
jgi:hypothetical protein